MNNTSVLEEIQNMDYLQKSPQYLYTDEKGNDIYAFKCQQPLCTNFYTAKKGSKAKSCGCLKRDNARKMGMANKKTNPICLIPRFGIGVCYYSNIEGYFIFDMEYVNFIREHNCTALINKKKKRTDPICTVNGKLVLLSRWIMQTPKGLEVDHINHDTNDLRRCNMRNCTKIENNYNRRNSKQGVVKQRSDGKYIITDFPKEDVSHLVFDNEEDAFITLFTLQNKHFGEFGTRRSLEISNSNMANYVERDAAQCLHKKLNDFFKEE